MKLHGLLLTCVLFFATLSLLGCGSDSNTASNTGNNGGTNAGNSSGGNSGGSNPGGSNTGNGGSSGGTSGGNTGGGTATGGLYVYAVSNGNLAGFRFDSEARSFSALPATLQFPQPLDRHQLTASPSGQFLYSLQNACTGTTCANDNQVFVQQVNTDGTLTAPKAIVNGDQQTIQVLISPATKFAFVLSATNDLKVYPIQSDGTFGAVAAVVNLPHVTVDPTFGGAWYTTMVGFTQTGGTYLWIAQNDVTRGSTSSKLISVQYNADTGGVIQSQTTDFNSITALESAGIVGDTLVVGVGGMFQSFSQGITTAQLANGMATEAQHCTTGVCTNMVPLIAHPTMRVVFGAHQIDSKSVQIQAFAIGADGSITPVGNAISYPSGQGPDQVHLAVSASGKYLFVTRPGDEQLTALSIDQSTGGLSEVTSTGVAAPGAVATATR